MAPPAGTLRVGRYFLALLLFVAVLYAAAFWPGQRHSPRLGLDLEGGFQVIFTAKAPGGKTPSRDAMKQAQQIMEERVNGSGVTNATVVIQGSDQIVISIPGSSGADVTKLGSAAVLNFRGVVAPIVPVACRPAVPAPGGSGSATPSTSPSAAPGSSPSNASPEQAKPSPSTNDAGHTRIAAAGLPLAAAPSDAPAPTVTPGQTSQPASTDSAPPASPAPAGSATAPAAPQAECTATPFAALEQAGIKIPTSEADFVKLPADQQQQISEALTHFDCTAGQEEPDLPDKYFIACDDGKRYGTPMAYLLGDVIVPGKEIKKAQANAPNPAAGTTEPSVSLELKSTGEAAWAKYTAAHNIGGQSVDSASGPQACGPGSTPCADYVAFTLDGVVISSPVNVSAINGGATQITGNFTMKTATELANQLKYGALPLSFKADQAQTVSATLGTSQLKSGLLAGGIGLILVVIYSLVYYRALGLVTIASLVVSGVLIWGSLVLLGNQIGFTLSLAGIAGFIVAVGITADSFVVFFEYIKDEVHHGRSMRVAIPRAWARARRTIISADTVSILAAAILYYFAAGDVKGFAFTLGLSTLLDLAIVFWFTHPLVSLLSRSKAFGSPRFTGLNAARVGPVRDDAPPARAAERASSGSRAAAGGAAGSAGTVVLPRPSAVDVLDRQSEAEDAEGSTGTASADDSAGTEIAEAADNAVDDPTPDPDDRGQSSQRRTTTPQGGTAAERAAARRARMRQEDER